MLDDHVRATVVEILRTAILRIRSLGQHGEALACGVEADHVHVLCEALQVPDEGMAWSLVKYYFQTMRICYMREPSAQVDAYERLWREIEAALVRRFGKDMRQW